MRAARLRLVVAAVLFCAWIGWLIYLAATTTRPIILSRPQFLASQADVVAELSADAQGNPDPDVRVGRVLWSRDDNVRPGGDRIKVENLPALTRPDGWDGPGPYILPLARTESGSWVVVGVPHSPGLGSQNAGPRIYRETSQTLAQHKEIRHQP